MQYTSREVYEYISKQTLDPIVERKVCAVSGTQFPIYESDYNFYKKISPTFAGTTFQIPTPTLCPEERSRRRLLWRNERTLYRRKCDATGETIISIYSPDKTFPVYHPTVWRSDNRDVLSYGFEFEFDLNFSAQFQKLLNMVPMPGRTAEEPTLVNSDYCNEAGYLKDCYLVFEGGLCESCYYSRGIVHGLWNVDCLNCYQCQYIYNCIECNNCNYTFSSDHCNDCDRVSYCTNCTNCKDCLDCHNMANAQYCIGNKQYDKADYEIEFASYKRHLASSNIVQRNNHNIMVENSYGEYLTNSKNMTFCYTCSECEDCRYCEFLLGGYPNKSSYDISNFGMGLNLCYESQCVGGNPGESYKLAFCNLCRPSTNLFYCHYCVASQDCFACVGLRNKQYCVFNKQYTKEEYETIVGNIIRKMIETGEWGEFFHPSLSPFGYNETVAQEYIPIHKEYADAHQYKRQSNNYEPSIPNGAHTIDRKSFASEAIQTLADEEVLKSIFVCEISGRPYRIIKQELDFYHKHSLALPRRHPDVRHQERMLLRAKRDLYLNYCYKCGKDMLSVYPRSHPEGSGAEGAIQESGDLDSSLRSEGPQVYCESCYQKEIYG